MENRLELVVDSKATLGEGPCWSAETQLLYWVDIYEKKINIYNPNNRKNRVIELDQYIGAIVPRNENEAVIALENGFYFIDLNTEKITLINEREKHLTNNRFNDGKCDAYGRFWIGSTNKSYHGADGALYCLDTKMKVRKVLNNISISNGIAWSVDNKFMYYIDTLTQKVCQYDYDIVTGEIKNPVDIISFHGEEGLPDGMTADTEGMLWIAHWGTTKISRWNPKTGKRICLIEIPAANVTSCVFGGKDLNELYITTARVGLSSDQLAEYPLSGGLFKLKTTIKGSPSYTFKG